eukprot:TRINITY_DN3740_c0_g2_i1.p1 TRINITY_DN3740_c0_g2~~TRINITY_DN3740_c0_g2_i1.p1  ORF type:complete len:352 (-),score=81.54 TRINITY_DN3740_c0_g2_i1:113-1168(-)
MELIDGAEETKTGPVIKSSHNLSSDAFQSFLRWTYFSDGDVAPLSATQLIEFSKAFGLSALRKLCEDKVSTNISSHTVLPILNVAYSAMEDNPSLKQELISSSLDFVAGHLKEIDLSSLQKAANSVSEYTFSNDPLIGLPGRIAVEILLALQSGNTTFTSNGSSSSAPSMKTKKGTLGKAKKKNSIESIDSHEDRQTTVPPVEVPPPPPLDNSGGWAAPRLPSSTPRPNNAKKPLIGSGAQVGAKRAPSSPTVNPSGNPPLAITPPVGQPPAYVSPPPENGPPGMIPPPRLNAPPPPLETPAILSVGGNRTLRNMSSQLASVPAAAPQEDSKTKKNKKKKKAKNSKKDKKK